MDDTQYPHENDEERPRRPRVVDKRVAARKAAAEAGNGPAQSQAEPKAPPETPPTTPEGPPTTSEEPSPTRESSAPGGPGGAREETLWTPEQEEQMRKMAEDMARVPSVEWVVNFAVNIANLAGVKLQSGQLSEAQLAIDALSGLLDATRGRLADAESPLRETLAQIQLEYARAGSSPPQGG
jgi:hypothetical protein